MMRRTWNPMSTPLLAIALASPAVALASTPFKARLEPRPGNSFVTSVRSASIQARSTNRSGANGLQITLKVSGALDSSGLPANVDTKLLVGFDSDPHCPASAHLPVSIRNGSARMTITGTELGVREANPFSERGLPLCIAPRLFRGSDPSKAILEVRVYSQTPGTIVQGAFVRNEIASNPITAWKTAKFRLQSIGGQSVASTSISGAKEGTSPSNRVLIPVVPAYDGVSCDASPYFIYGISLDGGRGRSVIPNLNNGGSDPGPCLSLLRLEDASLNLTSRGLGVVQGIDAD